jgi:dihydroneopterin aldolase
VRITLTGIEVWAHHGVLRHEAELGQPFLVDVEALLELDGPVVDDDLSTTVDYGALAEVVVGAVRSPRAALVETVAERTAAAVLDHDPRIAEVLLTLHKPRAPLTVPAADVAVSLTRRRDDRGR